MKRVVIPLKTQDVRKRSVFSAHVEEGKSGRRSPPSL